MRIADNTISGKIGKQVFEALWLDENNQSADEIIASKGLKQITDSGAIESIIDKIIADNPGQVEQYRSGKDKVFAFFVGQVMKAMQGKANPAEVNRMLIEKLK
jgi:aspartyl-tRNA(Asn)/glutamyl-tRNA(Gln) amidotransferase subunit B